MFKPSSIRKIIDLLNYLLTKRKTDETRTCARFSDGPFF